MLWPVAIYALFTLVAILNWLLMRRASPSPGAELPAVLIPARNEAANLAELIPQIVEQGARVYVFDDESTDGTAQVAARAGAIVLRPSAPLPAGWTGKNRACHELGRAAMEDAREEWILFLDADVRIASGALASMVELARRARVEVLTGFPQILPGRGVEPLFLAWVGWILLSTNPFGIVSRTRMGHNRFTNGQIGLWRRSLYGEVWPHEQVRDRILEDVMIGRLLARRGIRVETANLSRVLSVRMYETWRQAIDGMSKNSFEIAGSVPGTVALALGLAAVAWLWVLSGWPAYAIMVAGSVAVALTCRAPLWVAPLTPLTLTIGAGVVVRSLIWRLTGKTSWKGRTYSGSSPLP